ncbi:ComF family protein [Vibrio tapetis]|uniref:Protein GntX n=1 Tax=Vibrio tapetis subsp. tapetis TaxID=1671868 RepID=A0A2N8ZGN7_9VIBR|nr:ComF family protein [Vibrio tapetis]SON51070.1 Protein GntX [Vibrio tapetis subsp. tapetis]
MTKWLKQTLHHSFKGHCHLCGLSIESDENEGIWCQHCRTLFNPEPRCATCGLPNVINVERCGQCISTPPPWHRLYCVGDYQAPLDHYIHQMKFNRKFWYARDLAELLAPRILEPAQIITSVPLHWHRQLERGYNQSDHLAKALCGHLSISNRYNPNLFERTRPTKAQRDLSKRERQINLVDAFKLKSVPQESHVAIVDDVVTTGSTIRHLCQLLLEVGVEKIDIYCICRTPEPS